MERKILQAAFGLMIVLVIGSVGCKSPDAACKQRGDAYYARVEALKRDAHEKLKIGTKKDAVIRFFTENGIPVTFSRDGWNNLHDRVLPVGLRIRRRAPRVAREGR
jgi:hypothetical protein